MSSARVSAKAVTARNVLRQQVLATGSYLERKLSAVDNDSRAVHRAAAAAVDAHGSDSARALFAKFNEYNAAFFAGKLAAPLVLILQPTSARALGDYSPRDTHGLESRIRIAPRVLKRGDLFTFDVLLHEMVHAYAQEVVGDLEPGYRGHGPVFAELCNGIGAKLGLPPVAAKGRGGLPDCAHWPLHVRPEGYYPEPYVAPTRTKKETEEPSGDTSPDADDNDEREASAATLLGLRARLFEVGDVSADELDAIDHAIALLTC